MSTVAEKRPIFVVGYFNPNKFPVNISVPELGGSIQLDEGRFIVTKAGVKINDPLLERYCGPNRLQREISRDKVPVVALPCQKLDAPPSPGFKGVSQHVQKRVEGPNIRPETGVISFSSMEEAAKAGFFTPTKMSPESPLQETASGINPGLQSKHAPTVEYADADLAERPDISGTHMKTTVVNIPRSDARPKDTMTMTQVPKAEPKLVPQVQSNPQALPTPELPPELRADVIVESNEISGFQATKIEAPTNLPDPVLAPSEAPVTATAEKSKGFSCPACNDPKAQNYRFRSQLSDHVRRKHASDHDSIMASVPK